MAEYPAPGLTADWLNAWLAAIGITVLLPDAKLLWTDDPLPKAIFTLPDDSEPLAERVAAALPSPTEIDQLAIAGMGRKVWLAEYQMRAAGARATNDSSMSSSVTDLALDKDGLAEHGPLDPPAPRGETLFTRLVACRRDLDDRVQPAVTATLAGTAERRPMNGLGFDYRRLRPPPANNTVDPMVECLAFDALKLFPVRGNGRVGRQRGWTAPGGTPGAFTWVSWRPPLDVWAIDALMDEFYTSHSGVEARSKGVTAVFSSVPYQRRSDSDVTRAYASERIW